MNPIIILIIILIIIGLYIIITSSMLFYHRSIYHAYVSIVDENIEYLSNENKKIFIKMILDQIKLITNSSILKIHNDIKFYKNNNTWMENNSQEIPYFKKKNRNKSFKSLGI